MSKIGTKQILLNDSLASENIPTVFDTSNITRHKRNIKGFKKLTMSSMCLIPVIPVRV